MSDRERKEIEELVENDNNFYLAEVSDVVDEPKEETVWEEVQEIFKKNEGQLKQYRNIYDLYDDEDDDQYNEDEEAYNNY